MSTRKTAKKKRTANGQGAARSNAPYFEIRRSAIHGRGAFAVRAIPRGTRLVEYKGEIIDWDQVDRRYPDDDEEGKQNHTFLFEIDDDRVIDANVGGNRARWINHACTPNCQAIGEDDRIFIESIKAIRPGQELVYDYNIQLAERHTTPVKLRYVCKCGTRNCRGTILGKKR